MSSVSTAQSPTTLAEVFSLLSQRGSTMKIIAGGTDLMVLMNAHLLEDGQFLDIWRVDELRGIEDQGDVLRIGALTTYTQLIKKKIVEREPPPPVSAHPPPTPLH